MPRVININKKLPLTRLSRLHRTPNVTITLTNPISVHVVRINVIFICRFRSRLGCQVVVTNEMEEWEVSVPSSVSDARSPS